MFYWILRFAQDDNTRFGIIHYKLPAELFISNI